MRQNRLTLVVAGAAALVLLTKLVLYEVRESQVAVVTTFGEPTAEDSKPGLHVKWPAPIQRVRYFDRRSAVLEGPVEELRTRDGRAVLVGSFLLWRVTSPQAFLERARTRESAERLLTTLLRNAQSAAVSSARFGELVSADPGSLRYEAIEEAMLERIQQAMRDRAERTADAEGYGVEVTLAGIRKLGLPRDTTEAVFERMREERRRIAEQVLAEGRAEAGRIRAEAEGEREELLAEARAEERRILAEAERKAVEHRRALREDPELAVFLEKLEALRELLKGRSTVVLDTGQAPFDVLRPPEAGGAGDAGPEASGGGAADAGGEAGEDDSGGTTDEGEGSSRDE